MKQKEVILGTKPLSIEEVISVAKGKSVVKLSRYSKRAIKSSWRVIKDFVEGGKKIYGVTTGFGDFKDNFISKKEAQKLQRNLIRSHSAGVGEYFPEEIVRAILLLRANSLAKGYSGVRVEVVEKLCQFLNKGISPLIPKKGSVGASGDLAPLSHMALTILGEGEVLFRGKKMKSKKALRLAGIDPLSLGFKEGLALNNGTAVMTAVSVFTIYYGENLLKCADISAAMSLEALCGATNAFSKEVQEVRPYRGQKDSARNIRNLIKGSEILIQRECEKIQDAYSLRCVPQVHGASREIFYWARRMLEIEINSVTDNPLIFTNPPRIISGGNFHGEPIAFVADLLAIAIEEIASISERRTARLLDSHLSKGLPHFLIPPQKAGLNSGYMIAQYTAASLVSENKVLAHPASVDSIPTCANQEDHVSMGLISARKAKEILENCEKVIAIELLCASQGLDFRKPLKPGKGVKAAKECVRRYVNFLEQDRVLSPEIEKISSIIHSGRLVREVEREIGKLK